MPLQTVQEKESLKNHESTSPQPENETSTKDHCESQKKTVVSPPRQTPKRKAPEENPENQTPKKVSRPVWIRLTTCRSLWGSNERSQRRINHQQKRKTAAMVRQHRRNGRGRAQLPRRNPTEIQCNSIQVCSISAVVDRLEWPSSKW